MTLVRPEAPVDPPPPPIDGKSHTVQTSPLPVQATAQVPRRVETPLTAVPAPPQPRRWPRPAYRTVLVLAMAAGLSLSLFLPLSAGQTPVAIHPAVGGTWAWGGLRVVEGNGTGSQYRIGPYTYTLHGIVGSAAVLNQTNESSGAISVSAFGVQGTQYTATLCAPSCASPELEANISVFTAFREVGYANLTPQASVLEKGSAVPAWGLVNSATLLSENTTRLLQWQGEGPFSGRSGFQYSSVALTSQVSVRFAPALGLIPVSLSRGQSWSANVSYASVGSWDALYHAQTPRQGEVTSRSSGDLNGSGNLSALGDVSGASVLAPRLGARPLTLRLTGPWEIWNGLFVVPQASSIYAPVLQPWYHGGLGPAQALNTVVDWSPRVAHLGYVGTRTNYTATNLTVPGVDSSGNPNPGLPGPSPGALGPASVQATPLSPGAAEGFMGALLKAPTPSPVLPRPTLFPFGAGVILLVVALLGALVAPRWGVPPRVPEPDDGYAAYRVPPAETSPGPALPSLPGSPGGSAKEAPPDPLSFLL